MKTCKRCQSLKKGALIVKRGKTLNYSAKHWEMRNRCLIWRGQENVLAVPSAWKCAHVNNRSCSKIGVFSCTTGLYEHNSVWRQPMSVRGDDQWWKWGGKLFIIGFANWISWCNRAVWITQRLETKGVATTRQSAGDLVRWVALTITDVNGRWPKIAQFWRVFQ